MKRSITMLMLLTAALTLFATGCQSTQTTDAATDHRTANPSKGTVILNITSGPENPHCVTMALQLAGHCLDDGRSVVLFFNVDGVEVPTWGFSDTLAYHDRPITELLTDLMARGAKVLVCPHCMKAAELEASDLIGGAEVASRQSLLSPIDANTVVFTY